MKKSTRRKFILDSAMAASGVLMAPTTLLISADKKYMDCAPAKTKAAVAANAVSSVRSGNWSDPATWGGRVPGPADTPAILSSHSIVYDLSSTSVTGMNIKEGGTLIFDTSNSTTLESTRNILMEGTLQMRPSSPLVIQTLRFTGINEDDFIGAGMSVLESDIGLWVMNAGQLDILGSAKTSWTRAVSGIEAGAVDITLSDPPTGWIAGDDIVIAPTEPPTVGEAFRIGFENCILSRVSGSVITVDTEMSRPHPRINDQWTAEVMNLSRNVRIQGTLTGNSHIFIRSTKPQTVQYAELRYMGPRKDINGDGVKDKVSGRYGIHFHHANDGSRGSLVENTVVRDTANNAFVPHVSHGVTMRNNIAYNVTEPAFWWDEGDITHDTVWENNIVALNKFVPHSLTADGAPSFLNNGFEMGKGDNNIARNNVAVGIQSVNSGAYDWEANNDSVWAFTGNMAHNSDMGIRVWQNNTLNHVIEDFTCYHNTLGISHGAYANSFKYNGGILYANSLGLRIEAASTDSNRVRIENMVIDGAGISEYLIDVVSSPLDGAAPLFMRNLTLSGHTKAAIRDLSDTNKKSIDVIACTIASPEFYIESSALASEVIRVQPSGGQAFSLVRPDQPGTLVPGWNARRTNINAFAASIWGAGNGLKAEYFNSVDFTNPAFTRTDSNISFYEWSAGVNYAITGNNYSVRWTGRIEAQFSEKYTFYLGTGGGYRLWIDGKSIADDWVEHYPGTFISAPIDLVAGQKYDIKLEFFNTDAGTGMGLLWTSTSLPLEYVPQSQLYSAEITNPDNPPPPPLPASEKVLVIGTLVTNYIKVQCSENMTYRIYDILGRLLLSGNINTGMNLVPVVNLANGVLLFRAQSGKTFKLIKY